MPAAPALSSIPVGTVLAGKYRVTREIGRGGMAAVYEAQNVDIGKRVAVKVLNAEAVRHYGEPMLDALNRRKFDPEAAAAQAHLAGLSGASRSTTATTPGNLNLVLVDSRNQAREFLESAEGEAHLVKVIRRRRLEVGLA